MVEGKFTPENEISKEDIKQTLNQVYRHLYGRFERKNPENMNDQEIKHQIDVLQSLIVRHGAENVWDEFIKHGVSEDEIETAQSQETPARESQIVHTNMVIQEERGVKFDGNISATFGILGPGYYNALRRDLPEIKSKDHFNSLLLGSQSYHSANEFGIFSANINEHSQATVVDREDYSFRGTNPKVVKCIKADVRNIPLESGSQDLICSNILLPWLTQKGSIPSGEVIVDTFREAYRLLADQGILLMAELAPTASRDNLNSWMTTLMVQASLRDLNFDQVEDMPVWCFNSQKAKKDMDPNKIGLIQRSGYVNGRQQLVPFEFIIKAKKSEKMIEGRPSANVEEETPEQGGADEQSAPA